MTYQEEMDRVLTRAARSMTAEELYRWRIAKLAEMERPQLPKPRRSTQGRRR